MKNILKLISISLVSLFVTFSFANASSGVFKLSHDLGFGKDTNLDAITKGRLFQVVIMTQNRLVRKNLKGKVTASLATKWSANSEANEWTFNLRKGIKFHDGRAPEVFDTIIIFISIDLFRNIDKSFLKRSGTFPGFCAIFNEVF